MPRTGKNNPSPATTPTPAPAAKGRAKVLDYVGPPRHPHRVTIIRLARTRETYELRWRENVRDDSGRVFRERRTHPGGNTISAAYAAAEKIFQSLERSQGFQGAPPRAAIARTPKPARVLTLAEMIEQWLIQHPSNITKPATVEGYTTLLRSNVLTPLTYTPAGSKRPRTLNLASTPITEINVSHIHHLINALGTKPDARRKDAAVPISGATINATLRVLSAALNWAVKSRLILANPADGIRVAEYNKRTPTWFHTHQDFTTVISYLEEHAPPVLAPFVTMLTYLGLRLNELAALTWADIDLKTHRVNIRHNFDVRHRHSTPKTPSSQNWVPLHPDLIPVLKQHRASTRTPTGKKDLVFRGPRYGIIGSTLINNHLAAACTKTGLAYTVTAHSLRHTFANWLKQQGVPITDIQALLRHADPRTTSTYLHTNDTEKTTAIGKLPPIKAAGGATEPGRTQLLSADAG